MAQAGQEARHVAGVKVLSTCAWTVWTRGNTREPLLLSIFHWCLLGAQRSPHATPSWPSVHESSMKPIGA